MLDEEPEEAEDRESERSRGCDDMVFNVDKARRDVEDEERRAMLEEDER